MKTHKLDTVSLIFGLLFTMTGLVFIAFTNPWRAVFIDMQWSWLAPLALIALGVVVLLPVLRRSKHDAEHPGPSPDPAALEELPPSPLP